MIRAMLVAVFALLASCEINHRSDDFACSKNTDCAMGRICNDGFCIVAGTIDAARPIDAPPPGDGGSTNCPAPCTSCNVAAKTCTVNCSLTQACNQALLCPAGYKCDFQCNTDNACKSGINCQQSTGCTAECSGKSSCEKVLCGPGPCTIACTGPSSCRDVSCGNSCACDVTCSGSDSCQSGITCSSIACRSNRGCTSVPAFCNSCL
jgi:hypothetical protein